MYSNLAIVAQEITLGQTVIPSLFRLGGRPWAPPYKIGSRNAKPARGGVYADIRFVELTALISTHIL